MKSHVSFRLVAKMVALNDLMTLSSVTAVILRYFTEFGRCGTNHLKVVGVLCRRRPDENQEDASTASHLFVFDRELLVVLLYTEMSSTILKCGLLDDAELIVTHRNISAQHFFLFVVRHQSPPFSSAFTASCGRNYSRQRRRQVDEYPYIKP